jgi:hypothetical protein
LVKVAVVAVVVVVEEVAEVVAVQVSRVAVEVSKVAEETKTRHLVTPWVPSAETSNEGLALASIASSNTRLPLDLGA